MKLLCFLVIVAELKIHTSNTVFRTRWPTYVQKIHYNNPVKPPDYCNSAICPPNKKHITCGIKFWSPRCGKDHEGVRMTDYRADIVRNVNNFRRQVERGLGILPKAGKLKNIKWDDELAVMAMRVSNQCHEHSTSPCVNTFLYKDVGESSDFVKINQVSKGFNVISFLNLWFSYHKMMKRSYVRSFPDISPQDHLMVFANLIYEKNKKIGCGMLKSGKGRYLTCLFDKKIKPHEPLYYTRLARTNTSDYYYEDQALESNGSSTEATVSTVATAETIDI
ncbi:venom allergen 3 [Drosophila santomea]|uniref:venom allergen 3 n=1 Tax=Drosophila santomea TaxID=129105 RepID=UPI0019550111|nr:venom allergen 3 [Drosophila santomea]